MKILLLGANGQVGTELQRSLLPHGHLIVRDRPALELTDLQSLRETIMQQCPELIVNAAAYTAVDQAESEPEIAELINAKAVEIMAHCANELSALLIHYSTDYVFDGSGTSSFHPDDQPAPQNVYGATKLAGEQAIQQSGCQHLIFRTSWVYAAHGHNFVKTMLRLAQEKSSLQVVNDQIGAPTSAELIADVTALAILGYRNGLMQSGLYHLVANGETSWHGFATYILKAAQRLGLALTVNPDEIAGIPSSAYPTPAKRPANSRLCCQSLERALKIQLPDWRVHTERVVERLVAESGES